MSTTAAEDAPARPELAPSDTRTETTFLSQAAGLVGLALAVVGLVAVAAAARGGSAVVSEGTGYLFGVAGLALMFVHALRDTEAEVRRLYGGLALVLLLAAVVVSVYPYKVGAEQARSGALLLPWGAALGVLSLAFMVPFSRNETAPAYRRLIEGVTLWAGASLAASAVVAGLLVPDFLVGPGLVVGLLGVGFLALYLSNVDVGVGTGRRVAVGLGVLGLVTLAVAVGRAVAPTVLFEGPAALRTPDQRPDAWKVAARAAAVLAAVGVAAVALIRTVPLWLRAMLAVFGAALAGVLVAGAVTKPLLNAPAPFLVPYGLILAALGLIYCGVSLAMASEGHFVVIARRELAAYFYSPTGYLVLFGMCVVGWLGYYLFVETLLQLTRRQGAATDPITAHYLNFGILGAFLTVFLVPVVTMGLFAEEKRTGTFEVLLTAPVSEGTVTLAKFFAAWLFFLVCWLPMALYLVALRVAGGEAFDYRPVLTFYLALAATGAAFVAIGTFFSSLTRNQIVAAVMTFAALMGALLMLVFRESEQLPEDFRGLRVVFAQFDFLNLWQTAAQGQLAVQAVAVQLSVAAVFLFLTAKTLEARKWS